MTAGETTGEEMATAYEPGAHEAAIYERWERGGYFRPSGEGEPFTIIMPPPNLTGELHVGSALFVTLEDVLIRWHRMLGHDTLWQPGVDHAAIAVNGIVSGRLRDEGLDRITIGREAFLERVWSFVNESRDYMAQQFRHLGASADWERDIFTMDPGPQRAVRETFKRLYDDGLIYRGEYIVNWDPVAQTAISDLEVDHEEVDGHFWHVRYPLLDDSGAESGEHVVIATTRPETIPADTAIAVNPEDERFSGLVGRSVRVPMTARAVEIIADEAVSMEGGSGALKVTPGHDPVDFEIGRRHGLEILNIIALDGTMNELAGEAYAGLDRFECRDRIVADIEAAGLMEKIEPYRHAVGHSERTGAVIEPLISEQWYVKVEPLATPAIEAVRDGRIKFVPQRFERTYMHWMENLRDWCISRQIWWGHRIPVWYCDGCDEITVSVEDATACEHCGSASIRQDEDTLDTWFSSGLWPHSALGWPDGDAANVARYYPTQVMETGYDIIFFWVARMIMLSIYNMDGVVPFETVYLHGLVRGADGQKMSKSKGNVVDPRDAIAAYGADGLRYALVAGTSPGNDQHLSDQRLEAGRNLSNKLWNASRFVFSMVEEGDDLTLPPPENASTPATLIGSSPTPETKMAVEDRWILSRAHRVRRDVSRLLEDFELGEAVRQLRDFFWDEFADWYIELAKVRVREGDRTPVPVLVHVLDGLLRGLHPFMPFVTEEIWQRLQAIHPDPGGAPMLIVARYPEPDAARIDEQAERSMEAVQEFVRGVRNIRAERRVEASHWVETYIVGADATEVARAMQAQIEVLARARPLHIVEHVDDAPSEGVVTSVLATGRVVLPMAGLFDMEAERERLQKQIGEAEQNVGRIEGKLANEGFVSKAPAAVVEKERERLSTERTRLEGLRESVAELG